MHGLEILGGMNRAEAAAYDRARRAREKRRRLRQASEAGALLHEAGVSDETAAAFLAELEPAQIDALEQRV